MPAGLLLTLKMQRQTTDTCRPATPWVRLWAVFGILLLLLCSELQATHFHRIAARTAPHANGAEFLPGSDCADTETNCPLCFSNGSALPVGHVGTLSILLVPVETVADRASRFVPTELHFAQWTRPPPFPA